MLNRVGHDSELAEGGPAAKRKVQPAMVLFVLPSELLGELGGGSEDLPPVELVFIGSMAALDFAVDLGAARRNLSVNHPRGPAASLFGPWGPW